MPGWAKLPLDIFTSYDVNPTDAIVYALLLDISSPINGETTIRKSQCRQSYICERLNLSRATVIRSLERLEQNDLIGRSRTGRADLYIITVVN